MSGNPRIKYDIAADVSGQGDVDALARTLEGLALTLDGDVKRSALASAQALRELGARQGALDNFAKLKTEAQGAAQRLGEAQAAAQRLARELANTEPTRQQAGQMQKLRDAVRAAKDEATAQALAVQKARATLQGYGIDTTNLAGKQQQIRQAIAQTRAQVEAIVPSYQRTATAAAAAGTAQQRAAQQAGQAVRGLAGEMQALQAIQRTLQGALAAAGLGLGLREIADAADAYASLQSRIKLVTGEGDAFRQAFEGVREVAARTSGDLVETGNLFQRLAQAGKDAGKSTQQAVTDSLALAETINQAIAVSGASADASKAAITQLIQGLQSGVLRGEEFNSVMEQAPRLARALADGLGVTTGELRKMAEAGALTTSTVIGSLQSQAATLRGEFESLPPTIGRALQSLSNSWTAYIGEADKANGISAAAAGALNALAGNIGSVVAALTAMGKAAAAFKLLDLAQQLHAKASAATAAAAGLKAETAATLESTAATRINTAANRENAAAKAAAAVATAASTEAAGKAAAANLTLGQAFARTGAAAAGALARIGGFAAGVGAAWLAVDVGGDVLKRTGTAIGEGIARLLGYRDANKAVEDGLRDLAAREAAGLEIRRRQAEANKAATEKTFELSKASKQLLSDFDGIVTKGGSAADAIAKIGKDFDLSQVEGIKTAGAVLDKLAADGKLSATQFADAWAGAIKDVDLSELEVKARAAFAGASREAERLGAVLDASTREAIRRTGLDFDVISGGMGRASRSAINDTEAMIAGLDRLKAQGVDTSRALTASLSKSIQTADGERALEAIRSQIESLRRVLGDRVTDGLLDQARTKAIALKDALDDATPGVTSLREAFRQLGLETPETLANIAKANREAWQRIKDEGTVGTDVLKQAFAKYAEAAIKAAGAAAGEQRTLTEAALQTEAAAKGLAVAFDESGRAIVKGAFEGAKAIDGVTEATNRATDATRDLTQAREEAIAAAEREIELAAREAAVREERRTVRDTGGNVVNQGVPTLTSIINQLKSLGVDPARAQQIAREFTDSQGNVPYFSNPGQRKYGKDFDTLDMAVQRAAEKELYGQGTPLNGPKPAPVGGEPGGQVPASGGARTINLSLNGAPAVPVNFATANDATNFERWLDQLQTAAKTAARAA